MTSTGCSPSPSSLGEDKNSISSTDVEMELSSTSSSSWTSQKEANEPLSTEKSVLKEVEAQEESTEKGSLHSSSPSSSPLSPSAFSSSLSSGKHDDQPLPSKKDKESEKEEGREASLEKDPSQLVPGTVSSSIPRLRGKQAWREKGGEGGRRSFGRFCRQLANKNRGSWQEKKRLKEVLKSIKEDERERKEKRAEMLRKKREKTEAKKRRKEENELKSCPVQIIKNTSKLRTWGKKARKNLVKMSSEMIAKLYGVSLQN